MDRRPDPLPVGLDLGSGPPLVLLPGFGTRPGLYTATARRLAHRCRVVVPDPVALRGRWRYPEVVARLAATTAPLGAPLTVVAHSFGGALALGLAARHPEGLSDMVFADTLAMSGQWMLAEEATRHPLRLLRMATPQAAASFAAAWATHPRQLVEAAWWGFRSQRADEVAAVAAAPVRAHVLWANRDSLLSRDDGRRFAAALGASFTVVGAAGWVDHDWMYRHPQLFVDHLARLGVPGLAEPAPAGEPARRPSRWGRETTG